MIVALVIIGVFVFKAPHLTWLGGLLAVLFLVLKLIIKERIEKRQQTKPDYFEWWQDNQGL